MKQPFNIFFLFILLLFSIGCTRQPTIIEPKTSAVALRAMQSTQVNSTDTKAIVKTVLQLLQDDNYEIKNLDSDMGYFNASKKLDGGKEDYEFAWYDIYYPIAIYKYMSLGNYVKEVSATISVRDFKNKSMVRASFVMEIKNDNNELVSRATIEDPIFYQNFFNKLDKAMFLEKNNI